MPRPTRRSTFFWNASRLCISGSVSRCERFSRAFSEWLEKNARERMDAAIQDERQMLPPVERIGVTPCAASSALLGPLGAGSFTSPSTHADGAASAISGS
jgi:hypothetical protein